MRGKRGVGYCKSMPGAVHPFERLKARNIARAAAKALKEGNASDSKPNDPKDPKVPASKKGEPNPTDLLFPKPHRELFNAILEEEEPKLDREERPRTPYSLRHTYICLRLLEGADIYQIPKNCRTSVEMIKKYYAAHIKTNLDAAALNIMRPKKKPEEAPAAHPHDDNDHDADL